MAWQNEQALNSLRCKQSAPVGKRLIQEGRTRSNSAWTQKLFRAVGYPAQGVSVRFIDKRKTQISQIVLIALQHILSAVEFCGDNLRQGGSKLQ